MVTSNYFWTPMYNQGSLGEMGRSEGGTMVSPRWHSLYCHQYDIIHQHLKRVCTLLTVRRGWHATPYTRTLQDHGSMNNITGDGRTKVLLITFQQYRKSDKYTKRTIVKIHARTWYKNITRPIFNQHVLEFIKPKQVGIAYLASKCVQANRADTRNRKQ